MQARAIPAHGRGRPKLGDWRISVNLPDAIWRELLRRETETGVYRTRICAAILENELIGHSQQYASPHAQ